MGRWWSLSYVDRFLTQPRDPGVGMSIILGGGQQHEFLHSISASECLISSARNSFLLPPWLQPHCPQLDTTILMHTIDWDDASPELYRPWNFTLWHFHILFYGSSQFLTSHIRYACCSALQSTQGDGRSSLIFLVGPGLGKGSGTRLADFMSTCQKLEPFGKWETQLKMPLPNWSVGKPVVYTFYMHIYWEGPTHCRHFHIWAVPHLVLNDEK